MELTPPAPETTSDRLLSVIIVGYNASEWLARCLTSLAGAGAPSCPFEVVLVDNASEPPLQEVLPEQALQGVHLVTLQTNVGFGNGVNTGRTRCRGEVLLLLNPDIEVLPGSIDRMLDFFDADPSRGLVGGRTETPDRVMDPRNAFDQPTMWSQFCFATGLSTALPRSPLFNPEAIPGWARDTPREVGVVTGCSLLTSAAFFDELGGFDPSFFLYGEDVDLCARALRAGRRPAVDPSAVFVHAFGASSTSTRKRIMVLRGKAHLYARSGSTWSRPLSALLLQSGVLLRAALETAVGLRRPRPRDWRDAWAARREWRGGWDVAPVPVVVDGDSWVTRT